MLYGKPMPNLQSTPNKLVFESPVQSQFLTSGHLNRDWDQSAFILKQKKQTETGLSANILQL